tara:strand:+ start:1750 stop:2340 length:591 start_codon:yes stop_codon:yes gene_type:complete
MQLVIHRVNTVKELLKIPKQFGCEIDIRSFNGKLILNHDPYKSGDLLKDYLENYEHQLLILNIKEAGIEEDVIKMVKSKRIKNYFLLDVEFPYLYKYSRLGQKNIAVRFSEDEPIELAIKYKDKVNWVWIDTNTQLPLNEQIIEDLKGFKSCLVCPERWNRPEDILVYREKMSKLCFTPDAVMTSLKNVELWQKKI